MSEQHHDDADESKHLTKHTEEDVKGPDGYVARHEDDKHHEQKPHKTVLYRDRFIEVTDEGVTIFLYYFPFGNSKFLPFHSIVAVNDAKADLNLNILAYKGWGMGLSNIWWAMRFGRLFHHLIDLVIDHGTHIRCGFSVESKTALDVIRQNIKKGH